MFVLCPHCEFLVGVDPRSGQPPAICPKCGQALDRAQADDVPAVAEEVPVPPEAPVVVQAAPEPPPEPARPQLDPDAVIAAMATKPRKSRAKPRAEAKPHASEKAPSRRKRAERPTPAPATAPIDAPTPAARPPQPSLAARIAAWWSPGNRGETPASPEPSLPQPAGETKRKASVRPIPSLRDRAAARAAAKHATQMPEIEALSIDVAPTFDPVAAEPGHARAVPEPALIEHAVIEHAVIEPPVAEPVVIEPPVAEPVAVPHSDVEAQIVAPEAVESPVVAAADAEPTAAAPLPLPEPRIIPPKATAPSFLRKRSGPATSIAHWQQVATLGGLSLLLVLQLLLAQRDALAADARWRPAIGALCTVARCALPAWREPDAFTMLSRDVRPHARVPGTLQIDASFRNDARWAQPWPRLVLTLSDIDGRVLGTRAFTAAEYLGARPTQNTLASGQSAAIRLAVVEPAPGVVAFSFEFR